VSGDDRSWNDGDKLSFSERDRRRREGRSSDEPRPGGKQSQERADAAAKQYIKAIDGIFSGGSKAEVEKLVQAMRNAHGSPGLADACRAYRDAAGLPAEASLISLFLDTGEPELILAGFDALRAGHESGIVKPTGGLRSQLRILAEDADDDVAEGAEALLEEL
jgi:hypothetical protein